MAIPKNIAERQPKNAPTVLKKPTPNQSVTKTLNATTVHYHTRLDHVPAKDTKLKGKYLRYKPSQESLEPRPSCCIIETIQTMQQATLPPLQPHSLVMIAAQHHLLSFKLMLMLNENTSAVHQCRPDNVIDSAWYRCGNGRGMEAHGAPC